MRRLAIAAVCLLGALPARAHGPAPVALEVLAHDGGAPTWLRTNVGLARARGDGTYEYVCPSRWDDNELARAAVSLDGDSILVHSHGVAYLSRDAGCTFEAITDDALYVTAAAGTADGFLLVAEDYPDDADPDASRLLEVVDGALRPVEPPFPGRIDGVLGTASGDVLAGPGFVAGPAGAITPLALDASRVTPRAVGDGGLLWLHATGGGATWLVRIEDGAVIEGPPHDVIHGPVAVGGRWIAIFDGVVHERSGGDWTPLGEPAWTCLGARGARSFACSLSGTWALQGEDLLAESELVFSMRQLAPPRACGDAEATRACELDWLHFGGESGWLDTAPARTPTEPRRPPGGCAARPGRGGSWILTFVVLIAGSRARRRRRP
ncbi:MAG TPA: hypothetical protein RMH99_19845 [Sandaracinaceae bacterium LLY-WYZ-13_1]|nr:hypothetical protein [Sandaracinaceae bacterium LLY-WYZ-13_1]